MKVFSRHLFILILLSLFAVRGNSTADSLRDVLSGHSLRDSLRVTMLLELSRNLSHFKDPREIIAIGKEVLAISTEIGYQHGIARGYYLQGRATLGEGNFDAALSNAYRALKESRSSGDRAYEGFSLVLIGRISAWQERPEASREYFQQALKIGEEIRHDRLQAAALYQSGIAAAKLGDYRQSEIYFKRSLDISSKNDFKHLMIMNVTWQGRLHLFQKLFPASEKLFHKALEMNQNFSGGVFSENAIRDGLGGLYLETGQYDLAAKQMLAALHNARKMNNLLTEKYLYAELVAIEKKRGNYLQMANYYDRYVAIQDSLFSQTRARQIAELETQFETEKKVQQIALLQRDREIQSLWRNLFAAGLLLTLILVLLGYQFIRYRSAKNQQLYEAQQRQTEQLQETNRLKSRFFANISHEFRTPLTLLLGPIETLLSREADQQDRQLLTMMQRNAKRLLKLINQLLDLSKIEAGKLELKTALANIVPFLRGLIMSFHSLAEQKEILLKFAAPEDEILLYFDREKIEQVIINLLSNAFKFSRNDGKVEVALARVTRNGRPYLNICVSDTGIGIPDEQLPHIFDRFYQVDSGDCRANEGTGIGLSLVKEFVELHHGEILVESLRGQGSQFNIFLPFGREHLSEDQISIYQPASENALQLAAESLEHHMFSEALTGELVESSSGEDYSQEKAPHLLIIEDNDDLRRYIREALAGEKYRISEAVNGKQGLKMALAELPDLIISDVMMPEMNGIECCRRLKNDSRSSHIPIILLTAKTSAEDRLLGLENLADHYLGKPFQIRELSVCIKSLLAIRDRVQERFRSSVIVQPSNIEVNSMEKDFLENLMAVLEENLEEENFGVDALSEKMAMSRGHLYRKLMALTDHTPSQFIRRFRLQRAMDLLKQNAGTISEIAYSVGFSTPTYFSKCFTDEYGYSPKVARDRARADIREREVDLIG